MANELKGYVKIWRRARHHLLWNIKPFDQWHAWEYLISWAAFARTERHFQRHIFILERGEHITTVKQLQRDWGWRSWARVRAFLDDLTRMEMIREQNERGCLRLTLCNFNAWQGHGKLAGRQPANPPGDRREMTGRELRRSRREEESGASPDRRRALATGLKDPKDFTPAEARIALEFAARSTVTMDPAVQETLARIAAQSA